VWYSWPNGVGGAVVGVTGAAVGLWDGDFVGDDVGVDVGGTTPQIVLYVTRPP